MATAELIVELVLTGVLMLVALLAPAYFSFEGQLGLSSEFPTVAIAAGFVSDGVRHWFEQLRVRIRIARTVVVLTPALTTSSVIAIWTANADAAPTRS